MPNRPPIPWLLGGACVVLAVASFRSTSVLVPEPATTAKLTWRVLHDGPPRVRGPNGLGVFLSGVQSNGRTMFAVAPVQALRSDDDGRTWQEPAKPRGAIDIAFGDSGLVLATTNRSDILRSTDGGVTWKETKTDGTRGLRLFVHGNTAFATGKDILLRSRDRGATWQQVTVPKARLSNVAMRGSLVIVVGSAGLVLRSTDAGETFQTQWLDVQEGLSSVAFVDDTTIVSVGSLGTILRSADEGRTWSQVASPTRSFLWSVAFADARHGLAVGAWGDAVVTVDGGATWTRERTGTDVHFFSVSAHPGGGFLVCGLRETILRVTTP